MRFDPSKMETRGMTFKTGAIDEEKRTVNISVSSEAPVERSFGKGNLRS